MGKRIFNAVIFAVIAMLSAQPLFAENQALGHIQKLGNFSGVAIEMYSDGNFAEAIGVVRIYPNAHKIEMVTFNFSDNADASIVTQNFSITEIDEVDTKKVVFKGFNDIGYPYVASYSIMNEDFVDFNLVIEGRGRVEFKNIGPSGLKIRDKYLKHINLGRINRSK